MTDNRIEKIRAEIERRYNYHKDHADDYAGTEHFWKANEDRELLSFIDSMQEEPAIPDIVDEHWWEMLGEEPKKCMYSKDDYTDEDRKVLCDGCEEECKYNHSVNVPFDSKNYELIEATYYIPKGMCAIVEDDKVIIKKK